MQNVYTVAQVNSYIKNMFTQDFMLQSILVKGEVSNCKYHSSGHIYFTLKDEKGTMACVMFAGNRTGLAFRLTEGQQVIVGGSVDVYERDGKYQMYAKQILLDGAGLLYERYEKLKKDLEERGMFAREYKQNIPSFVQTLGVVTAPTGAAVRDIINVATRRNPYIQIILYPAIVQGEQAAPSIIKGIQTLEQRGVDVIIVGRGGGSLEDLWAFNEESVAQAIFDCRVPIISAVGHETDTTIADYVSDLRAPTPSAAAELAVFDYEQFLYRLQETNQRLNKNFTRQIEKKRDVLSRYQLKLRYLSPLNQIREKRTYTLRLEEQIQEAMKQLIGLKRHTLELYMEKMKGLSPIDKLNQGFSLVTGEDGKAVTDVEKVALGQKICIQVKNGELKAEITGKEKKIWE